MAYSNTAVSSLSDLLSAIAAFAGANGWTAVVDGVTGGTKSVTLNHSSGTYVSMIVSGKYIYMNGHRSYSAGSAWNAQGDQYYKASDATTRSICYFTTSTLTSVHLFAGSSPAPYLYAAVEISSGYYRHLCIGQLEKQGAFAGGWFFDCTEIDDSVGYVYSTTWERNRYPLLWNDTYQATPKKGGIDAVDTAGNPAWYSFCNSTYDRAGFMGSELQQWIDTTPIQFNQNTPLISPWVWAKPSNYVPLGRPPNMRYISMENYVAGDEEPLGGDVWKIFPAIRKLDYRYSGGSYSHDPAFESSHLIGLAYKK